MIRRFRKKCFQLMTKQYYLNGLEVQPFWVVIAKDIDSGAMFEHGPFYTEITVPESGVKAQYSGSEARYNFSVEKRHYMPTGALLDWLKHTLSMAQTNIHLTI